MSKMRLSLSLVSLLIFAVLWLPRIVSAQTAPKSKSRRTQNRKARTRNNRAGRDKEAQKTVEQKPLCPEELKGTCPGTFSLVYTFVTQTRPRQGDNPTDLRSLGLVFNVYVTPRVFVELAQDHVISQQAVGQTRATGVGDSTAVIGADALLESPKTPGVAVLYGVKLPSASALKGLGSGKVDQQLAANLHKSYGRNYFEYDAGVILARVPNSEATRSTTLGAGVMSGLMQRTLNRNHLLHFQLDATLPSHGYKGDLSALSFWQTRLNDHVSLRLGAATGLTSNLPRAGFYAAFIWEDNLRRWWRH